MNSQTMHVCCSTDDNYAQFCGVMLCSLLENNKDKQFHVHVLIADLSKDSRGKLLEVVSSRNSFCHFHKVNSEVLKGVKYRDNKPLSEATYYRILLSSILDESISKVLYLDADMVVLGDISPLFEIDMTGYAVAATKDLAIMTDERRFQLPLSYDKSYFCAGMLLINLDYWRENNSEEKLLVYSKADHKVIDHDQSALNAVFRNNWLMISPKWNRCYPIIYKNSYFENRQDRVEFEKQPIIIHYCYIKPWTHIRWFGLYWNKYWNCYYRFRQLTPWKGEKYRKLDKGRFGLYQYIITTSIKKTVINTFNTFVNVIYYHFEDIIFFPFTVLFAIKRYIKIRLQHHFPDVVNDDKHHLHRSH